MFRHRMANTCPARVLEKSGLDLWALPARCSDLPLLEAQYAARRQWADPPIERTHRPAPLWLDRMRYRSEELERLRAQIRPGTSAQPALHRRHLSRSRQA